MTETSFTQANPAFVPSEVTPVATEEFEVFEFGNDEPIAIVVDPQVVDAPVYEEDEPEPIEEDDVEEPPADEE